MRLIMELRPVFRKAKMTLPRKIKASCGWPRSRQGTGGSKPAEAECWAVTHSRSGHVEIFVSPILHRDLEVAVTMVHELVHARQISPDHELTWQEESERIGLILGNPVWDTKPNKTLRRELQAILKRVGSYPHAGMKV